MGPADGHGSGHPISCLFQRGRQQTQESAAFAGRRMHCLRLRWRQAVPQAQRPPRHPLAPYKHGPLVRGDKRGEDDVRGKMMILLRQGRSWDRSRRQPKGFAAPRSGGRQIFWPFSAVHAKIPPNAERGPGQGGLVVRSERPKGPEAWISRIGDSSQLDAQTGHVHLSHLVPPVGLRGTTCPGAAQCPAPTASRRQQGQLFILNIKGLPILDAMLLPQGGAGTAFGIRDF